MKDRGVMGGLLALAVLLAAPAMAQPQPGPMAAPGMPMQAADAVPPLDPARLAAARIVMAKLFPPGTYRALMNGSMTQMMSGMTRQMMSLPVSQLAGMAGVPKADLDRMGSTTLQQIMAILDPAFERRMAISTKLMFDQIIELVIRYEPDIREAYAAAYASRMTVAQLHDLDAFLMTPSGRVYAANAIPAFADPAVVRQMQTLTPAIIGAMPGIAAKVQAATADLPKPRKAQDLTEAERAKLAKLMGVDPAKLNVKEPTS